MSLDKYKGKVVTALTNGINLQKDALQTYVGLYSSDCKALIEDNIIATWDTGATCCVIDETLARRKELIPVSRSLMNTVGGQVVSNVYNLSLKLPNNFYIPNILIYSGNVFGGGMLIGMNVFKLGDFAITNFQNQTIFTFRIPSLEKIDYVDEINKSNIFNQKRQIPFKSPCPCNSGQQYKDCCGRKRT